MKLWQISKYIKGALWDEPNTDYQRGQNDILEELLLLIDGDIPQKEDKKLIKKDEQDFDKQTTMGNNSEDDEIF